MHEYSKRIGEHIKSCYSDYNKMNREELDELKTWACVMKDLTEYDINKRAIEAMDEYKEEEKLYGRMGYRGRDSRGRFVHRPGRGRSAGYTPYMHMMDEMDDYDIYDEMPYLMNGYRMGYSGGRGGNSGNMGNSGNYSSDSSYGGNYSGNSGSGQNSGRYGYDNTRPHSRYGESYDRYSDSRRHYHESGDADSKRRMEESIGEIFDDIESMFQNVLSDMTPEQKQKYKTKMTQMVQKIQ